MKLSINSNFLCIQLTNEEMEWFRREGYIEVNTPFVSNLFSFALQITTSDNYGHELSADFQNGLITVFIPQKLASAWIRSDMEKIESCMEVDNGEKLYLLLRKEDGSFNEKAEVEEAEALKNALDLRSN